MKPQKTSLDMKQEILVHLNDPAKLEGLYRNNRIPFKRDFSILYPQLRGNAIAEFWHERLQYVGEEFSWGTRREMLFVIVASLLAGVYAKLPAIFSINEEFFYPRNIGFIIFPSLISYFIWKNKLSGRISLVIVGLVLAGLIFINLFPGVTTSDTLVLSCIHLVLFLWALLGVAFVGGNRNHPENRLSYLKYTGDLVVMTALILMAGGIMTAITIGLFQLIGFNIEDFYAEWIAVFGAVTAPVLGAYLTQTNPQLVGKVSPVIARIFSPLVLVMLVTYLVVIVYSGKDPYNDREFLLLFNGLLVGVMAIIFFSIAGTSGKSRTETWILLLLSVVTIVVSCIALSAIVFRIAEWGITPNRAAVLGGNLLILVNLLFVTVRLQRVLARKDHIDSVGKVIASYLPLYCIWTVIVTFIFPLLFGFN